MGVQMKRWVRSGEKLRCGSSWFPVSTGGRAEPVLVKLLSLTLFCEKLQGLFLT